MSLVKVYIPGWRASELIHSARAISGVIGNQRSLYFTDSTMTITKTDFMGFKDLYDTRKYKIVESAIYNSKTFPEALHIEVLKLENTQTSPVDSIIRSESSRYWKLTENAEIHEAYFGDRASVPSWWISLFVSGPHPGEFEPIIRLFLPLNKPTQECLKDS